MEALGNNSQLEPEVIAERRLQSAIHPMLRNITCDFLNGVLVLRGRVPTYHLKQLAQATVANLEAVQRIDNQVEVVNPM